jgi:hypothetical protein
LHNHAAIAREHPFQRGERSVHITEVSHFRHASKSASIRAAAAST